MATIKIYELDYEGFLNELTDREVERVQGGGRKNKVSINQDNDADVDIDSDKGDNEVNIDQDNFADVDIDN